MRRWLLVFLILLLPVRGWVGNAMAGEMVERQVAAATQAVAQAPADHDCPGHDTATPVDHDASDTEAVSHGDCPTCASCQVCSAVALATPFATPAALGWSQPRPDAREPMHPSAERASAFKPPIS